DLLAASPEQGPPTDTRFRTSFPCIPWFCEQGPLTDTRSRTDRHGDPLPPGATARLGTVRFRSVGWFRFSPDGKALAALDRPVLRLVDVTTGKERHQFQGPPGGYAGAPAFSPRGRRLAAVDGRGTLFLWETATGKEVRRFPVPVRSFLTERAFSP